MLNERRMKKKNLRENRAAKRLFFLSKDDKLIPTFDFFVVILFRVLLKSTAAKVTVTGVLLITTVE